MSGPPEPVSGAFGGAAEAIYRAAVSLRGTLYDRKILRARRLDASVISVGNVTAGGTGKTPVVIELAGRFARAGRKVAILSRGYGRDDAGVLREVPLSAELPADAHRLFGDEPCLMRRRLPRIPIILAADRLAGGREAIVRHGADLLLLDDGMQHRRIHRDGELVVLSAAAPFGNGHLLPRGLLRESPRSIARADLILLNETGGRSEVLDRELRDAGAPGKRVFFRYRPEDLLAPDDGPAGLDSIRGANVIALSAIGNPRSFESVLVDAGALLAGSRPFRDHHRFRDDELREAADLARRRGATVVTTEKDAVRIAPALRRKHQVHILTISFRLTGGEEYLSEMVESSGNKGG